MFDKQDIDEIKRIVGELTILPWNKDRPKDSWLSLPKCFGGWDVQSPQSRAENCCDECPHESNCRAALEWRSK